MPMNTVYREQSEFIGDTGWNIVVLVPLWSLVISELINL